MSRLAFALAVGSSLLVGCGSRPALVDDASTPGDDPTVTTGNPSDDAPTGPTRPPPDLGAPAPDAAAPVPDAHGEWQLYLLWAAPGGYAGTGPAIEVLEDGRVRLWKAAPHDLTPHRTSGWSIEVSLPFERVEMLLQMIRKIDLTALPHDIAIGQECYPWLYFQNWTDAVKLTYDSAVELIPEFRPVYDWFERELGHLGFTLPSGYCIDECTPPLVLHPATGSCVTPRSLPGTVNCGPDTDGRCPVGQTCEHYIGWGEHWTCEIRCGRPPARACPEGHGCSDLADGPQDVCWPLE